MDTIPTVFKFTSYKFEPEKKRIFFNYKQEFKGEEPINFTETLVLPEVPDLNGLPEGLVDKILQGVHLILGISYYKFYCSPAVALAKAGATLSKKESDFWNIIYRKGLGEFFYKNKLNPKNSPRFSFNKKREPTSFSLERNDKCLVAVGGGKDSIVATELLKESSFAKASAGQAGDLTAMYIETQKRSPLVDKVTDIMGVKSLKIRRYLDKKVFDKNAGYYQGHIPISAIYGFLMLLSAILYRYSYLVVANEYSSNFGNVKYKGETINHQWSKSSEFENLFQDFVGNFISPDIHYFSLLRPFYEIRIAEMFSKYKKYFPYFSSCNKNFKIDKNKKIIQSYGSDYGTASLCDRKNNNLWCCQCFKCAFVFLLLSAFLEKKELINIFGRNLFEDKNLLTLFRDILGFGKLKPFDCVGTFEESRLALFLARDKFKDSLVVKTFLQRLKNPEALIKKVFKTQNSAVPDSLKFLGMKNAAILGYGKEGEISEKYLKKNFPKLKVDILDQKFDKDYLKKQEGYDILIKTPVIPKERVKILYTTATNIFFSKINQLGNQTIGVTGSKGKSTTTSLIFTILKEAGKNVKILGNIGNPMLETLMSPIKKDEIFVLELSSYQLDDIAFSPNIAVVTNLFPEHMDYHSGLENYYQAKKNIIKFQTDKDIFVYNPKNKKIRSWLREAGGKTVPFASKIPLQGSEIPLLGEHNKENIRAAVAVAREFGVADETVNKAIKRFKPLSHRLEFVGKFRGIKFYDDAISTTPESTIMAIKSLKNVSTIFLGGEDRGYDFSQLEKAIQKYKIKNIVLFPVSGKRILKSILRHGSGGLNVLKTSSMGAAVRFAYRHTEPGKICLLSCASPSYSLWKNFEEKGDQFQKIVFEYGRN